MCLLREGTANSNFYAAEIPRYWREEDLKVGYYYPIPRPHPISIVRRNRPLTSLRSSRRLWWTNLLDIWRRHDCFTTVSTVFEVVDRACCSQQNADHSVLMRKLGVLGTRGTLLAWVRCFLLGQKQAVAAEGMVSERSTIGSDLPQYWGLLCFLSILQISIANDTMQLSRQDRSEDRNRLQKDLDKVHSWAEANNMLFNDTKFEQI